ncbi:hypothetical protein GCM10010404_22660 [Nonomuraea africana]
MSSNQQGTAAYLLFEGGGYVGHMASDFEAQLRAVSLRVTRPRLAVLAALYDHAHVDTDTVIALVRAKRSGSSEEADERHPGQRPLQRTGRGPEGGGRLPGRA